MNALFTTLNTSAVTVDQLRNVFALTNETTSPATLFFQIETEDFNDDNERIARNVTFENGLFVCSCGGDTCEHIILAVAFIKEQKMQDWFEVETFEVVDRNEKIIGGVLSLTYIVKSQRTREIESVQLLPINRYCSCKEAQESQDSSHTTCPHIQAAQAFERQFQNELAEHASR